MEVISMVHKSWPINWLPNGPNAVVYPLN